MSALTPAPAAATGDLAAVAAFLYHEAELLDLYALEEWLALYAEDATYWIPQGGRESDPRFEVQLMLDDRRRLRERVLRISGGHAYSQDPRSSTVHLIGNVRIAGEEEGALDVRSVQLITELGQFKSEDVRVALEPFLQDASEPVRFATVTSVFELGFDASTPALVAALAGEESQRIKNRIAQRLTELGWAVPSELRDVAQGALPNGYRLQNDRVVTA